MDLSQPFRAVTPTLDGDVLTVLARAEEGFSGRQIHRLVGHGSEQGVRKAVERLARQGVVNKSQIGRANVYRLNREHLAAPHIEGLAFMRTGLLERLRAAIERWQIPPRLALLFGSAARGEAGSSSDLDLLVVRRADVGGDDETWVEQLGDLERQATEWTGNDARIVEFDERELAGREAQGFIEDALADGIDLFGSRRRFRRAIREDRES
jgi:predicted nucleotidyltransferase